MTMRWLFFCLLPLQAILGNDVGSFRKLMQYNTYQAPHQGSTGPDSTSSTSYQQRASTSYSVSSSQQRQPSSQQGQSSQTYSGSYPQPSSQSSSQQGQTSQAYSGSYPSSSQGQSSSQQGQSSPSYSASYPQSSQNKAGTSQSSPQGQSYSASYPQPSSQPGQSSSAQSPSQPVQSSSSRSPPKQYASYTITQSTQSFGAPTMTTSSSSSSSQTAVSDTALIGDLCTSNVPVCYEGHIRLCVANISMQYARVVQDCRSQGCSHCAQGPDLCNDVDNQNVCDRVSQNLFAADCTGQKQGSSYCDNDHVRVCGADGRGVLVEYCDNRSCQQSPAQCFPSLSPTDVCQGTYLHCYQGNIRMCKDKVPLAQSEIVQSCRAQGCSACPNGPPMCNDEQQVSQCNMVTSDRYYINCTASLEDRTYCADGDDMRYCASGRASIVEYCDTRGCQIDRCNAPGMGKANSPTVSSKNCGPRVRFEWGAMPDAARVQFIRALNQLYARGDIAQLAQLHNDNSDRIYGDNVLHFLLWNRVFLNDFEERLRSLPGYECVTVPYWNYDYSNNPADRRSAFGTLSTKLGQGDTAGCIGGAFAPVTHTLEGNTTCIQRNPDSQYLSTLKNSYFVDLCRIGEQNFPSFSSNVQVAQGYPHVAVGGTFATQYSPIDPLFFPHHANVDRIWDMWQDCHADFTWYEPTGLNTPIAGYDGVNAGDFVDNSHYRWKNNSYSLSYRSDQFEDPSIYSSDFRRSILTRCRDGKLRRYDTPNPVLGVDDSWARVPDRSLNLQPGGAFSNTQSQFPDVQVKRQNVSVSCVNNSGTRDLVTLKTATVPLAVYDNFVFQDCMILCATFYWKSSGVTNCVCMSFSQQQNQGTTNFANASIKWLQPSCLGAEGNYAFYQISQNIDQGAKTVTTTNITTTDAADGRRLQAVVQTTNTTTVNTTTVQSITEGSSKQFSSEETNAGSSEEALLLNETFVTFDINMTVNESSSEESLEFIGWVEKVIVSVTTASHSNNATDGRRLQAVVQTINTTIVNSTTTVVNTTTVQSAMEGSSEQTSSSEEAGPQNTMPAMSPGTSSDIIWRQVSLGSQNDVGSEESLGMLNGSTEFNQSSIQFLAVQLIPLNESSSEASVEDSSQESFSSQMCFDVLVVPKNQNEAVCSSAASTPAPLPSAWLRMNNLSPDLANVCNAWKPAVGFTSISCINV